MSMPPDAAMLQNTYIHAIFIAHADIRGARRESIGYCQPAPAQNNARPCPLFQGFHGHTHGSSIPSAAPHLPPLPYMPCRRFFIIIFEENGSNTRITYTCNLFPGKREGHGMPQNVYNRNEKAGRDL